MAQTSSFLAHPKTHVDIEEGSGFRYVFTVANCQGWRSTQEDAHLTEASFQEKTSLFGVFDGHGGPEVAQFVANHFAEYLAKNTNYKTGNIERGIEEVFMLLDETLMTEDGKKKLQKYHTKCKVPHLTSGENGIAWLTGCTGVVLLIKDDNYYCANVGDSRCLLMRGGNPIVLSQDHKPDMAEEKARIEKAGGKVEAGRVNGVLDVSRAFGDFHLKQTKGMTEKEKMVTAWPHIKVMHAQLKADDFLLLYCDGIWNAMDNKALAEFVKAGLSKKKEMRNICKEIIKQILPLTWPSTPEIAGRDNMTLMVIKPRQEKHKSKQSKKSKSAGSTKSSKSSKSSKSTNKHK